ncbi:MAG: carboxypeptidase [Gracilimonas sp.]|uniref:S10 family peptidase n=1 Tax=Gracilimonas TaxID=649462 RepID=UPI001B2BC2AE|nr:carboxypeptidase [Gracilimonas sp.]MBO6587060.1 carboxypeptidase [Gracilimonas sp.]MBO6614452.1 carboxypeptidase [Gracilimonas sp.]
MKSGFKIFLFLCSLSVVLLPQLAQGQAVETDDFSKTDYRTSKIDWSKTSEHQVTIKGKKVPYTTTVGNQPVWNEEGKPIASLFYTYYERSDVKNKERRPLVFSFNGGPGSASVWMHIGYTGPKKLKIDDEGFPIQPYGVEDNPHSILDVADIVFVNPVNVAFSRILDPETERSEFFGVNADVEYLADWINTFVNRQNRWPSPKYLIGESYGTTRVSGLANELQSSYWMYLNGVILVSPTGLGVDRDGPVEDATALPYYAATAWYHDALGSELQSKDLDEILPEVEAFAINEFIPALAKGGFLEDSEKQRIAEKVSEYSGLSVESILDRNLRISTSFFWKELLRDQGLTVGRLDSRYRGVDRQNAGERYDYDPALTAWNHAFTPAINHYLRDELGYETDLQYWTFGPVHPWDRSGDNTGEDLRSAMAENPFLHVLIQSGYYDGGTNYFDAKYTMWNMDPSGRLKDRLSFKGYRSGHMMYLRAEDLATSNEDIRVFIENSIPEEGMPARY